MKEFPWLPVFLLFCATPLHSEEIGPRTLLYAPLAGIHQSQSLFESVLFRENTPSTFQAYVADARGGGSGAIGKVLVPLFVPRADEENKRSNGWAIGASSGFQRDALFANDIFVPGFYFFEGLAGRATTESWTIGGTGLRGYMELALRNQRPTKTVRQQNRLALVSRSIPDDNYFLVLRMGAGSDNQGSGLVTQKPSRLSWAIQGAFYAPLKDKQGYANIKVSPYGLCFGKNYVCGMHFFYMNLFKGQKKPNSEFTNHFSMATLFLRYQRYQNLSVELELFESLSSSPVVVRGIAVYSNRSSYSQYPGFKSSLSFGF